MVNTCLVDIFCGRLFVYFGGCFFLVVKFLLSEKFLIFLVERFCERVVCRYFFCVFLVDFFGAMEFL